MNGVKKEPSDETWIGRGVTESHLLILASGRRLNVDLCYDKEKWQLEELRAVGALDDLSIVLLNTSADLTFAVFTLSQPGETFQYISRWERSVRFRAGPVVARCVGTSSRVICQGRVEEEMERGEGEYTVRIEVTETQWSNDTPKAFIAKFGSRWVDADRAARLPEETLALFSPFFMQRFYGKLEDRARDSLPIERVAMDDLEMALALSIEPYRRRVRRMREMDTAALCSLIAACHRLSFPHLLSDFVVLVFDLVHNCESGNIFRALQLGALCNDNVMIPYVLSRFCLTDCLVRMLADNFNALSKEHVQAVSQRMAELSRIAQERKKVRLSFAQGDIIVALLTHEHPRPCQALLNQIRERRGDVVVTRSMQNMWEGKGLVLRESLDASDRKQLLFYPPSSSPDAPLLLLYTYSKTPRLFFSSCARAEDLVLGVVVVGAADVQRMQHLHKIAQC